MLLGQGRGKLKWKVVYEIDSCGEPKVFSELMTKEVAKNYCLVFEGLFIENVNTEEKVRIKKVAMIDKLIIKTCLCVSISMSVIIFYLMLH